MAAQVKPGRGNFVDGKFALEALPLYPSPHEVGVEALAAAPIT